MDEPILSVAQFVPNTEAEGPGKRFALWFQGCPLRCASCCNPEYLPFKGGTPWKLSDMVAEIERAQRDQGIEGVTLIGGEPFAHAAGAAPLAQALQQRGLTVMIFSGYTIEELRERHDDAIDALLAATDILVDGPYERDKPDSSRRWIGSTNQRIHFLTPRYHADDPCWKQRNTLEIRVDASGILVNGFPAAHAVQLWKGMKLPKPTSAGGPQES